MNDYRKVLYDKYISTFKEVINNQNEKILKSNKIVFGKRYFPLLKDFNKDAQIIDLGCGSGDILSILKEEGYHNLCGIDISQEQIDEAKEKGLNADTGNIFDFLNTNNKKFDIIFLVDVIEHLTKPEIVELFPKLNNILKPKGIIIIHTPNGAAIFPNKQIYGDLTHQTIFTTTSLIQILTFSGFTDINFYESGPISKNIKGFIRVVLWNLIKIIFKMIRIIETGSKENILTQDLICTARKK